VAPRSKPTKDDLDVLESLVQLSAIVQLTLTRAAEAQDLTPVQARLLMVLSDRQPTMLVLARIMGLGKSSLTGLVDRAEGRGLVERFTTEESRRAVRVRLTAEGRRRCAAYLKVVRPRLFELVAALPVVERRTLGELTRHVVRDYVVARDIDVSTMDSPMKFV
jgi:DNA-binding MarR family transcriptional regulator